MVGEIMTIIFKTGNILDATENLICHQTNFMKVMGGGLALQIKNKWPNVFKEYCEFIDKHTFVEVAKFGYLNSCRVSINPFQCVINLFGQYDFGRDKQYTNYDALECQLNALKTYAESFNYSVALPYKIGCGLAGGDWYTVNSIIEKIFNNSDVQVAIYKFNE
jgi:O-acetyl-ADP-ribose deacetylase (regulator of RNase III)